MQHKPFEVIATPSPQQKTRRTADQWQDLFKTYEGSGLSQQVFCQQQGIALSTFYSWRKKLRERHTLGGSQLQQDQFVELTPPIASPSIDNSWDVELAFANGMTLRLRT
jgi:transposase-like protein